MRRQKMRILSSERDDEGVGFRIELTRFAFFCHPRECGDPDSINTNLDSLFQGNDGGEGFKITYPRFNSYRWSEDSILKSLAQEIRK